MLPLLPVFSLAQVIPVQLPSNTSTPPSQEIVVQPQEIRALPGQLNRVLVFNSNSPEVIRTEGILLSTFPGTERSTPAAHLDLPLQGRFDLFAHHIARANKPGDVRPLYLGALVYNPSDRPVTIDVLQAVSYVTNPDAPFIDLPPHVDNSGGTVYSGPGSRLVNDFLRGVHHRSIFPSKLVIPPKQSQMLFNLPMAHGNGRSTLMRLQSNGPVYMASLAMYARPNSESKRNQNYRPPQLEEWQQLLNTGNLVAPRDRPPTPPEQTNIDIIYGRVAGVAQGSEWETEIVDRGKKELSIPQRGEAFGYPISTVTGVTFGTEQVQSAPLLVRYPDTAYRAHGNYGVHYRLTLPLVNNTERFQTVVLTLQTPLQRDDHEKQEDELRFLNPPDQQVFFRGTVQLSYKDDQGVPRTRYVHLVQRRGQQGEPLIRLNMLPGDRREVKVDLLYPPDSTPPQVLTVTTLGR